MALRQISSMYQLINSHVEELLQTVAPEYDVHPYVWMLHSLPNVDVSRDQEFQRKYCSYWALNGAGLGQAFRSSYFSLLERSKHSPASAAVETIARELHKIPVNTTGRTSLQFSFASKLAHMLNPRLPVYDRMVETFYFLPRSYSGTPDSKLLNLTRSYRFLISEYERVLRERLLEAAISAFRQHVALTSDYSDEKIIDTLIWKFIPFLERGAIRGGSVVYG
jgi:hypothetical protein